MRTLIRQALYSELAGQAVGKWPAEIKPSEVRIVGVGGEGVTVMGVISLAITVKDAHDHTERVIGLDEVLVTDQAAYQLILGQVTRPRETHKCKVSIE